MTLEHSKTLSTVSTNNALFMELEALGKHTDSWNLMRRGHKNKIPELGQSEWFETTNFSAIINGQCNDKSKLCTTN